MATRKRIHPARLLMPSQRSFRKVSLLLILSLFLNSAVPAFALKQIQTQESGVEEKLTRELVEQPETSAELEKWSGGPPLRLDLESEPRAVIWGFTEPGNRLWIELTRKRPTQATFSFKVDRPDGSRPDEEVIVFSAFLMDDFFSSAPDENETVRQQWDQLWDPEAGTLREGVTGPALQAFLLKNPVLLPKLEQKKAAVIAARAEQLRLGRPAGSLGLSFREPTSASQRLPERAAFAFDVSGDDPSKWKPLFYLKVDVNPSKNFVTLHFLTAPTVRVDREPVYISKQKELAQTASTPTLPSPPQTLAAGVEEEIAAAAALYQSWGGGPNLGLSLYGRTSVVLYGFSGSTELWLNFDPLRSRAEDPIQYSFGFQTQQSGGRPAETGMRVRVIPAETLYAMASEIAQRSSRLGGAELGVAWNAEESRFDFDQPETFELLNSAEMSVELETWSPKGEPRLEMYGQLVVFYAAPNSRFTPLADLKLLPFGRFRGRRMDDEPFLHVSLPRTVRIDHQGVYIRKQGEMSRRTSAGVEETVVPDAAVPYPYDWRIAELEEIFGGTQGFDLRRERFERLFKQPLAPAGHWEGEIQPTSPNGVPGELAAWVAENKMTPERVAESIEWIREMHPYDRRRFISLQQLPSVRAFLAKHPEARFNLFGVREDVSIVDSFKIRQFMDEYLRKILKPGKKGEVNFPGGVQYSSGNAIQGNVENLAWLKARGWVPKDFKITMVAMMAYLKPKKLKKIKKFIARGLVDRIVTPDEIAKEYLADSQKAGVVPAKHRGLAVDPVALDDINQVLKLLDWWSEKHGRAHIYASNSLSAIVGGASMYQDIVEAFTRDHAYLQGLLGEAFPQAPPKVIIMPAAGGGPYGGLGFRAWQLGHDTITIGTMPTLRTASNADGLGIQMIQELARNLSRLLGTNHLQLTEVSERALLKAFAELHDAGIRVEPSSAIAYAQVLYLMENKPEFFSKFLAENGQPMTLVAVLTGHNFEKSDVAFARRKVQELGLNRPHALRADPTVGLIRSPNDGEITAKVEGKTVTFKHKDQAPVRLEFLAPVSEVFFSPDGLKAIVRTAPTSSIHLIDLSPLAFGNRPNKPWLRSVSKTDEVVFEPDSKSVFITSSSRRIRLDVLTGKWVSAGLEEIYKLSGTSQEFFFSGFAGGTPPPLEASDILRKHEVLEQLPARVALKPGETVLIQFSGAPTLSSQTSRFALVQRLSRRPFIRVFPVAGDDSFVVDDYLTSQVRNQYLFQVPVRLKAHPWRSARLVRQRAKLVYDTGGTPVTLPIRLTKRGTELVIDYSAIAQAGRFLVHRFQSAGVEETAYEGKAWNELLDKIREAGVGNFTSAEILIGPVSGKGPSLLWSSTNARVELATFISTTLNRGESAWGALVGRNKAQLTLKLSGQGQERHAFIQVEMDRLSDDVPGDDLEERPASRRWPHDDENAGVEETDLAERVLKFVASYYAFPKSEVKLETLLSALPGDSLFFAGFILDLEDEFDLSAIPDEESDHWKTVGDVIEFVKQVSTGEKSLRLRAEGVLRDPTERLKGLYRIQTIEPGPQGQIRLAEVEQTGIPTGSPPVVVRRDQILPTAIYYAPDLTLAAGVEENLTILQGHTNTPTGIAFGSKDLFSVSVDGTARVWDPVKGGESLARLRPNAGQASYDSYDSVASHAELGLVAVGRVGEITLYDAASGKERTSIAIPGFRPEQLFFDPAARKLIALGVDRDAGRLRVWDVSQPSAHREIQDFLIPDSRVWVDAAVSREGTTAAVISEERKLYLIHEVGIPGRTRRDEMPIQVELKDLTAVEFDATGRHLFLGSLGGIVVIKDLANGTEKVITPSNAGNGFGIVHGFSLSPDGTRLAVASGKEVSVVDVAQDKTIAVAPHSIDWFDVNRVAFSPDGLRLAYTGIAREGGYPVAVWDLSAAGVE
ncbi:MAG: LpqB family beta-propeller domain-containing protein, partial [Candidatus Omnitrophota bacterium]|nr:LpqB family beta-propeller domain-containing protein [Candidatus Omnitrophota bacterium]